MVLKGKVAIVTGASRGIGLEIARMFKEEGAIVIGTYNNTKSSEIGIDYRKLDITKEKDVEKFVNSIKKKYAKIDILVNNAGITGDSLTYNMTLDKFNKVINTNIVGTFNITKLVGPVMQEAKKGSIINIASIVGLYGNIGQVNYAASKSAIIGMTHTWAKEFAIKKGNVRVNAISPGVTKTDMIKTIPTEILNKFKNMTLLKRLAEPKDIANLAVFLASDNSSYITDEVISVSGGLKL